MAANANDLASASTATEHTQHATNLYSHAPPQPTAGPPSIISSRMTDIASEEGDRDHEAASQTASHIRSVGDAPGNKRRSLLASEVASRPETARTGTSARAWSGNQPLRVPHFSTSGAGNAHRGSIGGGSTTTATSIMSRSGIGSRGHNSRNHVPSVANQAFFHPMSSQKLQAQRAGTAGRRPSETPSTHSALSAMAPTNAATNFSAGLARMGKPFGEDDRDLHAQSPPSRGTEWTEQETLDRLTANTSPTGHRPQESLTESMKPLQRRRDRETELIVDTSRQYSTSKNTQAVRTHNRSPTKTSRSFRSSLFNPTGASQARNNGAEKLASAASSPRLASTESHDDVEDIKTSAKATGPNGKSRLNNGGSGSKVYQYFDGNTVFCLNGRLQNTHAKPINIATGVLVALPIGLFFGFSAKWIWKHISPAIPLTFAYIAYLCLSSFLRASTSDPGILPRNLHSFPQDTSENPTASLLPTNDWVLVKSAEASTAAMEVPVKHCRTCDIWRPPRAHHCRLCDNCIEGHDHHCVWLNNCVGRRNYRFFLTFVSSAAFLSLYMVGACLAQLLVYKNRQKVEFSDAISEFPVPFAMVIYGILAGLYPLALTGYHIFLMARGETTREYINSHKFTKSERYRAFSQGSIWRNWIVVLCRPRPVSFYQFKKQYVQGDQRLGELRRDQRKRGSLELHNVRPVAMAAGAGSGVGPVQPGFQGPTALRNEARVELGDR
ncbi:Palmitoyltransferase ERF2 [Ceratocystis fimbriata CBS 114723]|uniref:Palmitoyltransferase n=1 Tax=Ceratocystis fimbriata CBS 114723 TaxID=1035309 RepID=A0A2C5X2P5_9PEZI|nr:Palmitoyltransferase ERF2 [Ceratocystis fimbriata CBS 114723]